MRESKITFAAIGLVVALLLVYLFVFQVGKNEVAVHYRPPGKVYRKFNLDPDEDQSGLHFRLPWPFDSVEKYDRRVRVLDGKLTETQLQDEWQVIISMYAAWRITDPVAFKATLEGDEAVAEKNIKEIVQNETSKVVAKRTFEEFVNTDKEKLKLGDITKQIADGVRAALKKEGYGVSLVDFGIRRTAIPEETTEAVFERMKEERAQIASKHEAEGRKEMDRIVAEAEAEAKKIKAEAEAIAINTRREAEEEESQFYDIFAKSPELAIYLRRLEALRKIAEQARESGQPITFILDPQTEPLTLLKEGPGKD